MEQPQTIDTVARAEAERRYPADRRLREHSAYLQGRADERARIAALRKKVVRVLDTVVDLPAHRASWSQEMRDAYDATLDFGTGAKVARMILVRDAADKILAALEVSDQ